MMQLFSSAEGCVLERLFLTEPNKEKKFKRIAIILYQNDEQQEKSKNFFFSKNV
jgi:hypothetical protein